MDEIASGSGTGAAPVRIAPGAAAARVEVRSAPSESRGFGGWLRRLGAFAAWLFSGFGLLRALRPRDRFKNDELVVYAVHRSFYLWLMILAGFVGAEWVNIWPGSAIVWGWVYVWVVLITISTLLFDFGTLKVLLWGGIFAFIWLICKYLERVQNIAILSGIVGYFHNLRPELGHGMAAAISWLLLVPWIGSLFQSFCRGRKTFSPNSVEEWSLGEGSEIIDRSGLKFRMRYRDLLETILGFGAADLEALDINHNVTKRYENVLFLTFLWPRLDAILHQRAAVVDNTANDPVEVEPVQR